MATRNDIPAINIDFCADIEDESGKERKTTGREESEADDMNTSPKISVRFSEYSYSDTDLREPKEQNTSIRNSVSPELQFLQLDWANQETERRLSSKREFFRRTFYSQWDTNGDQSINFKQEDEYESDSEADICSSKSPKANAYIDRSRGKVHLTIAIADHKSMPGNQPAPVKHLPIIYNNGTILNNPRVITSEIIRVSETKQKSRQRRVHQLENRLQAQRNKRMALDEARQIEADRKKTEDSHLLDIRAGYGEGFIDKGENRGSLAVTVTGKKMERKERIQRKTFFTSKNFRMASLMNVLEKRDYKEIDAHWYDD